MILGLGCKRQGGCKSRGVKLILEKSRKLARGVKNRGVKVGGVKNRGVKVEGCKKQGCKKRAEGAKIFQKKGCKTRFYKGKSLLEGCKKRGVKKRGVKAVLSGGV